jgi:hypothetical protein
MLAQRFVHIRVLIVECLLQVNSLHMCRVVACQQLCAHPCSQSSLCCWSAQWLSLQGSPRTLWRQCWQQTRPCTRPWGSAQQWCQHRTSQGAPLQGRNGSSRANNSHKGAEKHVHTWQVNTSVEAACKQQQCVHYAGDTNTTQKAAAAAAAAVKAARYSLHTTALVCRAVAAGSVFSPLGQGVQAFCLLKPAE